MSSSKSRKHSFSKSSKTSRASTSHKIGKEKKIKVLGKTIRFANIPQLANKLNIGDTTTERRKNAKFVLSNLFKDKIIKNKQTGETQTIKLSDKPLLIKEFLGIKRISKNIKDFIILNKYVEAGDRLIIRDKIAKDYKDEKVIDVNVSLTIRIVISDTDGTLEKKSDRYLNYFYGGVQGDISILKHFIIDTGRTDGTIRFGYNKTTMTERKIKNTSYYDFGTDDVEQINENTLGPFVKNMIDEIHEYTNFANYIIIDKVILTPVNNVVDENLEYVPMMSSSELDISRNIFNEIINIDTNNNENCVINTLINKYKNINVNKHFEDSDTSKGINTNEVLNFCKKYGIQCIAYDINCNVVGSYYPDKKNGQKALAYISYNNHMYLLKNKLLHKKETKYDEVIQLSQHKLNKKFDELMSKNIVPTGIKLGEFDNEDTESINVKSFIDDKILYFHNHDYDICHQILKLFGLDDKIKPDTNRYSVMKIIEKLYNIDVKKENNTYSFFPELGQIKPKSFYYHTKEDFDESQVTTIDKCKAFACALYLLDYILQIDIRQANINKDPTIIRKECLYNIEAENSSNLIPKSGIYDGEHLIYCQEEGLSFKLLEEYECTMRNNKFKSMIKHYYEKIKTIIDEDNADLLKLIISIYIGQMENGNDEIKSYTSFLKICSFNEAMHTNGIDFKYNEKYSMCMNSEKVLNIHSRMPIKIQILNKHRRIMYEKMKELQLRDEDIIKIEVDSLSFINRNNVELIDLDKDDFTKWKTAEYSGYFNTNNEIINNVYDDVIRSKFKNNNELHLGYAGCGKTYNIINNVIPEIIKNEKSYIVLTPSHSCVEEYRQNKLNCNVIQSYEFGHQLPKEDVIIIDEIGLCDKAANDVIYKCYLLGKRIISYGDFGQLLPVMDYHYDNKNYLDKIYSKQFFNKANRRNTFTNEYYDSLINNEVDLLNEIKKHNTSNFYDAEYIICSSNPLCKIYNEKYMDYHGIKFSDIDSRVMCRTNVLGKTKKVYNNYIMNIIDYNDKEVKLKCEESIYTVTNKEFHRYFEPAYARTLYNVQGKTIMSYHIPDESLNNFNDSRSAYTIISRLSQDVIIKEKKTYPKVIKNNNKKGMKIKLI